MKRVWLLAVVLGCGGVEAPAKQDAAAVVADAPDTQGIDAPPPRCDPSKPFGTATLVPMINSTNQDWTPYLTPDELQIWFGSARAGGTGEVDIYMASRASRDAMFGMPSIVAGVNTTGTDQRPMLPADGLTMYIEYRIINGTQPYQIMMSTRMSTTTAFGGPTAAPFAMSGDVAPFVLPDHSAVYFVSGRGGNPDIYRVARNGTTFGTPVAATGTNLNSTSTEDYPVLAPNELTIYFASNRPGGAGGNDIWRATRSSVVQGFNEPINAADLNTVNDEVPGWVSADDCVMYLYRVNGANMFDIYIAKRPL